MNEQEGTASITIMNRTLEIQCPPEKRRALKQAEKYINDNIEVIKNKSQCFNYDEILIMTMLNITYELQSDLTRHKSRQTQTRTQLETLHEKTVTALQKTELVEIS